MPILANDCEDAVEILEQKLHIGPYVPATYNIFSKRMDIYTTIAALSPKSVFTNLYSKCDRFLPARSQFDTNHRVNVSTPTYYQSAIFVRPLFAFVLWFLRQTS